MIKALVAFDDTSFAFLKMVQGRDFDFGEAPSLVDPFA
jgi:hypothetical protein